MTSLAITDLDQTRVGPITAEIAQVIVQHCLGSALAQAASGDPASLCGGDTLPIFFTGGDVMDASAHDLAAIAGHPAWARLNKGPNGAPDQ